MKTGRPTKYKPEYCQPAYGQAQLGATDYQLAAFFNVSRDTIAEWKREYPEFRGHIEAGKEAADAVIEQAVYRMATGYTTEEVHFTSYKGAVTSTPYTKYHPPNLAAASFWLRSRNPQKWGNNPKYTPPEEKQTRQIFKLGDTEIEF